jgi:nicotinamidase-related amidase
MRAKGGWIASTHFTLVPGKGGEPFIAEHLKRMRPFLRKGDFAPASWGQALVNELAPSDLMVEKIGYDAFWNSRLEWALRKAGIRALLVAGIVTNGGVASTVRGAHVREFEVTVLEDGCAAFSSAIHQAAIEGLRPVARITNIAHALQKITGK